MWRIKFNHVQDLSDARFAASVMAEWFGFAIDGPFEVTPSEIQEIVGWCSGPKLIIEVHQAPLSKIESFLDVLPVNGIECNAERYSELKAAFPDVREWLVVGDNTGEYISHTLHWHPENHVVLLEPNMENAQRLLKEPIMGFSINAEKETELGKKDQAGWFDFFETLEIF
jgi:hypothetical protein